MSALGGSIEALLKLNISDFESQSKKAVGIAQDLQRSLNTGFNSNGLEKTSSTIQGIGSSIQQAESHASALGSTFTKTSGSLTPLVTDARTLQSTFPRIAEGAVLTSKQMDIQAGAVSRSNAQIRQMNQTLPAFFSSMDKMGTNTADNMTKVGTVMTGGWTRTTSAINTAGSAVKNIGSRISEAASSMSMFSASLATMIGTMGTQQVYDATVGKANSYLGMIQYWNTVYGSSASQNYQNTVNSMYTQHYQAKSDTTRTLQLLSNTMPLGTDSSEISSLTPIVAAYKNFYKAMKPEQAAMANIEAPQDIAAVFSGNTGEIRASPLASQLKTIASLPQDQKMAALQDLFAKNGVMNYLDGITTYDKNMNKLNATLDNLSITTGEELIPAATNVLTKINDFLQGLGSNGKYLVYLTGAVAGLAALGGVGSLAVMGLNGVYKGLTTAGSGAEWFGKKVGLLTDVLDENGKKVGTSISSKVTESLKSVPGKVSDALTTVKDKAYEALKPVGDKAGEALSDVQTKIVNRLNPIADAAGDAMSGVKSAVVTKLDELQTWINTSFHPTPTGGGGGGSVGTVERLASSGIPVVEGAAGAWLASKGMPLGSRVAITSMAGLSSGALSPLSGLLAPATFGLFDKGGPYGQPYTDQDVKQAYQNSLVRPNPSVGEPSLGQQLDLPDWLAGNIFGPTNGVMSSFYQGTGDWIKGAAGNTGSFFNWLGNTTSTGSIGGLGNINSSLGWLGKTATQGLGGSNPIGWLQGAAGNTNSFFSNIGKTGNDALGGFFGQFLPGGKGPQQSWLSQFLPGTSSAAGSGGNKGILNDITGKNGLLDFSRFIPKFTWPKVSLNSIGDGIKSKIPKLNWPNLSGIGQWVQSKIPKLSWPNLGGIGDWVQSKIPKLNWKIPTLDDVRNFVWGKITSLNWKIPTLDDVKGFVWGKITSLNWSVPNAWDILDAIKAKIPWLSWPSGPAGTVTGWVHRAESNFSNAMAQRSQAQAQSAANAKSYVQTSDFKQRMGTRWGGLIGRGPSGPRENKRNLKNMFSGFGYEDYEGSKKSIWQTLKDGAANCFDLSLAEMFMAGNMGLDSELVWSTWNGGSHVYPQIDGEVMDAAHYALNRSWTAPPKGPSDPKDSSTQGNEALTAVQQFQDSAVPNTGTKIGATINSSIVKPITAAIQYSTKYVKGGVTQINTDFTSLIPQATGAWNAVQNAVIGPIQIILDYVNRLRMAVGGSGSGFAGGDVAPGTKPTTISNGFEPVSSDLLTAQAGLDDLSSYGIDAETTLKAAYNDAGGLAAGGYAGGDIGCADGNCGDYGIFSGALNWVNTIKDFVNSEVTRLFGSLLPSSGGVPNPIPTIGGYFLPGGMYGGTAGTYDWINYCPFDQVYGSLLMNPKGTAEGELTCSICDADFDGVTGADKSGSGARAWLTPALSSQVQAWTNQKTAWLNPVTLGSSLFKSAMSKLFSAFHYQYYFDDQKSDAKTLLDKSGNCYDMTQLLMSYASAMGLSSSMVHGTWANTGIPHVWANIQGLGAMDPTAFVQRHTWTPPAAGGDTAMSPILPSSGGYSFQIIIEGDVNGVEDLDKKMEAAGEKLLNKIEGKLSLG